MQVKCKFHTKIREKRKVSQNLLARIVDVGNDEYIVGCNFADRIMSSFLNMEMGLQLRRRSQFFSSLTVIDNKTAFEAKLTSH